MKKRLTAILLALCLMLGIGMPAAPTSARADSYTVYVISNTLKVYNKASTSGKLLGTMAFGESMTCLATNDSWAAVKNSAGKIGYCKLSSLATSNPNNINTKAYITSNNIPVYRKPDTGADVMMKLKKNSCYTAVAITRDGNWVRLKNGKYYGYVQTKYVSTTAVEEDGDATPTMNSTVYIIDNTLKAYQKNSTSSKVLGTMSYGESMTLLAASGSWACIRNSSGAVGYCKLSGLSNVNPNTYSNKIYINSDNVKVYRKPDTGAGVMQVLNKNDSYTCVAITEDGAWMRLKNGKYYGYVQSKYISNLEVEETPEAQGVYVSEYTLTFYQEPDETSNELTTLPFGESMLLVNVNDGWAEVVLSNGKTAYCPYGGITKVNPNSLMDSYFAIEDDVNLYETPYEDDHIVKTIATNAAVTVVAITEDGEWARVNLGGGSFAYARMEKLSESKVAVDDGTIVPCDPVTVYIASTTLVCYEDNSTSSKALGTMSFGEILSCTGSGEGWARVMNSNGAIGYCKLSGLSYTNPNTYSVTLYSQAASVKVYEKATTSSDVMTTLALNAKLTAVCYSSDKAWIRVKSGSNYGYVQAKYLATTQVENAQTSSTVSKVISLAKEQLGIKYVYAAQSPSSGFDCSGFTYYVFKNAAGITLQRTAYTQGYNNSYTKITDRKDLKVGDLVFFNTVDDGASDLCDHVGIYIGDNEFIHASSAAGKVTISSLGTSSSSYYYRTFSWGRRIIN